MKKIGIDLGTTNSILSYYADGKPSTFSFRGQNEYYIPSFVSYEHETGNIDIGKSARIKQGDKRYKTYSRFKIFLGERDENRLKENNYGVKRPEEIAKLYFRELVNAYQNDQLGGKPIESLAITVPEIWIKEQQHAARESIRTICEELGLPKPRLISEPVAATAFFCHEYHKTYGKWFQGNVLVCDFGGGTLDLSLSEANGTQIKVLEATGKGHSKDTIGRAGVAFDQAVVSRFYQKCKGEKLLQSDKKYYKLLDEFEGRKIVEKLSIDKQLKTFLLTREDGVDMDSHLVIPYGDDDYEVTMSDMVAVYEDIIKPDFVRSLNEMMAFIKNNGIKYEDINKFRIVLVGGFSNFYLVRKTIEEFFKSSTATDPRFNNEFPLEDTALAISKGAALIANGVVEIIPTSKISLGMVMLSQKSDGSFQKTEVPIVVKGQKIPENAEPIFNKKQLIKVSNHDSPICIFLGDDNERLRFTIDKDREQIFPKLSADKDKNVYNVGFSIDDSEIMYFYARHESGVDKLTSLGEMMKTYHTPISLGGE